MQLTVFADGIPRIRPLLIFRGQGLRFKNSEKRAMGQKITVQFQKNAWSDEGVMVTWIQNNCGSYFSNPPTPGSNGKLLIADIYRGQETPKVKKYLRRSKTQLVNIPGGLAGYVQVLDVVVNKPFKAYVQGLSEKHMEENLEDYVGGKIGASERRGKAWEVYHGTQY